MLSSQDHKYDKFLDKVHHKDLDMDVHILKEGCIAILNVDCEYFHEQVTNKRKEKKNETLSHLGLVQTSWHRFSHL